MADPVKTIEVAETGFFIVLGLALVYGAYRVYSWLESNYGPGTPDPGGGAPAKTLIGGLANHFLELGKSSLSYEGAITQTVESPLQVIQSVVSYDDISSADFSSITP